MWVSLIFVFFIISSPIFGHEESSPYVNYQQKIIRALQEECKVYTPFPYVIERGDVERYLLDAQNCWPQYSSEHHLSAALTGFFDPFYERRSKLTILKLMGNYFLYPGKINYLACLIVCFYPEFRCHEKEEAISKISKLFSLDHTVEFTFADKRIKIPLLAAAIICSGRHQYWQNFYWHLMSHNLEAILTTFEYLPYIIPLEHIHGLYHLMIGVKITTEDPVLQSQINLWADLCKSHLGLKNYNRLRFLIPSSIREEELSKLKYEGRFELYKSLYLFEYEREVDSDSE